MRLEATHRLAAFAAVLATLAGCGGGGSDPPSPPENSTATFTVRAGFDTIAAAGVNVNLSGKDAVIPSVNLPNFNDWSGTYSLAKRPATASSTPPGCAGSAILIDARITLIRARDGLRVQDAMTLGYDASYKPICALLLDGSFWSWTFTQPLPATATVNGNLSGVTTGSPLSALVSLDPDTTGSAYLSFVYNLPAGSTLQMLGEATEFRYRIDPTGKFLGFQYRRTGFIGGSSTTLTLNSL